VTTECRLDLLSDEARRQAKVYCILAVSAYLAAFVGAILVLVCAHYEVIDVRFVGLGAMLPVMTRYLIGFTIGRRLNSLTDEPAPKISLVGSLISLCLIAAFIALPWL